MFRSSERTIISKRVSENRNRSYFFLSQMFLCLSCSYPAAEAADHPGGCRTAGSGAKFLVVEDLPESHGCWAASGAALPVGVRVLGRDWPRSVRGGDDSIVE